MRKLFDKLKCSFRDIVSEYTQLPICKGTHCASGFSETGLFSFQNNIQRRAL